MSARMDLADDPYTQEDIIGDGMVILSDLAEEEEEEIDAQMGLDYEELNYEEVDDWNSGKDDCEGVDDYQEEEDDDLNDKQDDGPDVAMNYGQAEDPEEDDWAEADKLFRVYKKQKQIKQSFPSSSKITKTNPLFGTVEPKYPMNKRDESMTLLVKRVPVTTTKRQLFDFFSTFGPIKAIRLRTMNDMPLVNRAQAEKTHTFFMAYIVFFDEATRNQVLENRNRFLLGRPIKLTEAVHPLNSLQRSVCIVNLPEAGMTRAILTNQFREYGFVNKIWFDLGRLGQPVAYVSFDDSSTAQLAMKSHGLRLPGQTQPMFLELGADQIEHEKNQKRVEIAVKRSQKASQLVAMVAKGHPLSRRQAHKIQVQRLQAQNYKPENMRWVRPQ